jgi:hypothetical protein
VLRSAPRPEVGGWLPPDEVDEARIVGGWIAAHDPPALELGPGDADGARVLRFVERARAALSASSAPPAGRPTPAR